MSWKGEFTGSFYQQFEAPGRTWADVFALSVEHHPRLLSKRFPTPLDSGLDGASTNRTLHPIRRKHPGRDFTWKTNYLDVTASGHRWCSVLKDRWACTGGVYKRHLSQTFPMNESLLATRFPTGSRIFMEGNSQFAQLAVSLICASTDPGLKVWTPTSDGNLGKELNLEHVTTTNDYIAHWPSSNTTLILLDNDDYWATYAPGNMKASKQDSLFRRENHLGRVLGLFDDLNFQPDVFVIGAINGELRAEAGATDWELARSRSARLQHYREALPNIEVIDFDTPYGKHCGADFRNCVPSAGAHLCVPSNDILRAAERLSVAIVHACVLSGGGARQRAA